MMFIESWGDVFARSLQSVWYGVASFIPHLVIALIIFAIGWVLAALIEKLIETIFKSLKIDAALKSAGLEDVVKRAGHNLNSGLFVGAIVKWFVIVVFLIASFDVLGLTQVNNFLRDVVDYLPQVIVAVLILIAAAIVGTAMQKIVAASSRAAHVKVAELLGRITKWAIWIFAILTALFNLGIAPWIQTILVAIFAGAALAFGLAFGLGGKEAAAKAIEKTIRAVEEKE
jgi:small-conductance mechanosensitive channel